MHLQWQKGRSSGPAGRGPSIQEGAAWAYAEGRPRAAAGGYQVATRGLPGLRGAARIYKVSSRGLLDAAANPHAAV